MTLMTGSRPPLLKFADDTKLLRKVGIQDECEELQKDDDDDDDYLELHPLGALL